MRRVGEKCEALDLQLPAMRWIDWRAATAWRVLVRTVPARTLLALILLALILLAFTLPGQLSARAAARTGTGRYALVLANSAYQGAPLPASASDAGLIAGILQDAGFEVAAARDIDLPAAQQSVQEFLNKISAAGPDAVSFVYIGGYGAQLLGENYLLLAAGHSPAGDALPAQGLLLSQLLRSLAAVPARARIVVLDLARANPLPAMATVPAGLALPDVPPGISLAMNAAPGTLAAPEPGPYGSYALALGAAMREPGLPIDEVFVRTRLHVSALTAGAQTPWHSPASGPAFTLLERPATALARSGTGDAVRVVRSRPVGILPEAEAYMAALDRDTLKGYSEFLAAFPQSALARRIAALLAARREALAWRHAVVDDQAPAYWTYLSRYAPGTHAGEARGRLAALKAESTPPAGFEPSDDGLSPPLDAERPYIERGAALDPPDYFAPPPPPPVWALLPPPWVPPAPPEADSPFALAAPELTPAGDGAALAQAGARGLAMPAAVVAAIAGHRLVPRSPPPPPLAAAPRKNAPVIIQPTEPEALAAAKPAPPAPPPEAPAAPPPAEVPAATPAPPPVPEQPRGPVMITPVEPEAPPAAAAPEPATPVPAEAAPMPKPSYNPLIRIETSETPTAPAWQVPPALKPSVAPGLETPALPKAAPPPAIVPARAPAKAPPKAAAKPRGPRVEPARPAAPAPAPRRPRVVDPAAPLDLRAPLR